MLSIRLRRLAKPTPYVRLPTGVKENRVLAAQKFSIL